MTASTKPHCPKRGENRAVRAVVTVARVGQMAQHPYHLLHRAHLLLQLDDVVAGAGFHLHPVSFRVDRQFGQGSTALMACVTPRAPPPRIITAIVWASVAVLAKGSAKPDAPRIGLAILARSRGVFGFSRWDEVPRQTCRSPRSPLT